MNIWSKIATSTTLTAIRIRGALRVPKKSPVRFVTGDPISITYYHNEDAILKDAEQQGVENNDIENDKEKIAQHLIVSKYNLQVTGFPDHPPTRVTQSTCSPIGPE